jgi:hypothetical protein
MHRLLLDASPSEPQLAQATGKLDSGEPRAGFLGELVGSKAFKGHHPILFKVGLSKVGPVAQTAAPAVAHVKPEVQRNCDLGILRRPLEFERGQVIYSYCLVLGRWPDGLGLATWTVNRRNGLTLEHFLVGLLQSDEFSQKYRTGELDNAGYVTLLYRLFLNRDPDGDGLANYVAMLGTGKMSRREGAERILDSDEFHKKHDALFTARMPEKTRAQLQQ